MFLDLYDVKVSVIAGNQVSFIALSCDAIRLFKERWGVKNMIKPKSELHNVLDVLDDNHLRYQAK